MVWRCDGDGRDVNKVNRPYTLLSLSPSHSNILSIPIPLTFNIHSTREPELHKKTMMMLMIMIIKPRANALYTSLLRSNVEKQHNRMEISSV